MPNAFKMDVSKGQDSLLSEDVSVGDAGKKLQQEKAFLPLVPYYHSLKKDADSIVEKTIRYLAIAVMRQDFQEGVVAASIQLWRYVEMYGLRFSKEQHIHLINLYLELLTMKTCPLNLISTLAFILRVLLEKPRLLTRDDLSIPWRPLYEILHSVPKTVYVVVARTLYALFLECNKYLEEGCFAEVVDEFRPMLCPNTEKMNDALLLFLHFIPYADPTAEEDVGKFLLELLEYYEVWSNEPDWEWNMMGMFAMTSWHMPRSLDWTPHLPTIYARLIKNMHLPVYFKGPYCSHNNDETFNHHFAAQWVVSTLGNNTESMFHFKNFLNCIETFLHPSCKWRPSLAALLDNLVVYFFERVKIERYPEDDITPWWCRWPEDKKLTDEDIDDFVTVISNLVLELYLYEEFSSPVMHNLASMRPHLIIPAVMDKYSEIVDTVTEYKRYMIVLRWAETSLVAMLRSSSWKMDSGYDGRHLVLPFLKTLLPAIDPNDMPKTICALERVTDVVLLIPLVDCSALADKAETEGEKELCRATACLENLLRQILERVLSLIHYQTLEDTRMMDNSSNLFNNEDERLEDVFWELFLGIGNHSSTKICQSVASKLARVALTSTMETEVSGRLFAVIVQAFAVARPDIILPMMLPQLCTSIESLVTDDMLDEEELDPELLFQLVLLFRIMGTNGKELLKYRPHIESTLTTLLKLNGKKGYEVAAKIITNILQSLVHIYPLESRISEADLDDPKYMAIRDWGAMMEAKSVKPSWHIPSNEELQWAKSLFLRIFTDYSAKIEAIDGCTEKQEGFNKRLLKNINILLAAYNGINTLLKFWDETPMEESLVDFTVSTSHCGIPEIKIVTPETGDNIMLKYYKLYCTVQEYLNKFKADDIDAYYVLSQGFYSLLVPNAELQKRSYSAVTRESVINQKKKLTRDALIMQTYELHLSHIRMMTRLNWTHGHSSVVQRLFQLCVNLYATVRVNAQTVFIEVVYAFEPFEPLIQRTVQPFLIEKLQEGVTHDEYKGALYIIGGWRTLLLNSRWQDLSDLWIALIRSPFSEKESIIGEMTEIQDVTDNFIHSPLKQEVPKDSRLTQLARELLQKELGRIDTSGSIDTSANKGHYTKLVKTLIQVGSDGDSHSRKKLMASDMLCVLISVDHDSHLTEEIVTFYLNGLISPIFELRKSAKLAMQKLVRFFKREYPLLTIDVEKDLELAPSESIHSILQYTSTNEESKYQVKGLPTASPLYVHKAYYGFAAMPTNLTLKQPVTNFRDLNTQKESRRNVLKTTEKFFTDEEYVATLMKVWSLDEHAIAGYEFQIVQYIARNHGPQAVRLLLQAARQCGVDKDKWKQRCAAEVIGGILRGMKLWDDKMVNDFWEKLLRPALTECLDSVTQETTGFWDGAIYVGTLNRDPNKLRFLIQFLKERLIESLNTAQSTSVNIAKEMRFLQRAMELLMGWRGGEVFSDIFALLISNFFHDTPNPFENVRVNLGRILAICLSWDVKHSTVRCGLSPKHEPFVSFLLGTLDSLGTKAANYQADVQGCEVNEEIRQLLLKFKSVLEWIQYTVNCMSSSVNPMILLFIPLLCQFESFESDPEVAQLCGKALTGLAKSTVALEHFDRLLGNLRQAAGLPVWKARVCVLQFVKVFVLNHSSILASAGWWAEEVRSLVMELLSDRKVEVREAAYQVLSGLLHSSLIKEPMDLLSKFRKDACTFATQRREHKRLSPEDVDALHSSVLGLCAFVHANQYQVPQYLPDVLILLTTHLNDPQPIPETIRKCLRDFRHRHQDDWNKHTAMFTVISEVEFNT